LERKLDPAKAKSMNIERIAMDKATFDKMHAENRMAYDKLDEGIKGFTKSLESLEQFLKERLARLDAGQPAGQPVGV
jgi:transaldolase